MLRMPQILALGEAIVEFNQSTRDQPNYLQGFGDVSNFLIAASRQGATTGFVSAVGSDHFGQLLLDLWKRENVDTSDVRIDRDAPTGVYFVSHGMTGIASTICARDRRRAVTRRRICRSIPSRRPKSCTCRASVSRSACRPAMPRSPPSITRARMA